ncbi:MAG: hypothetical protein GF334_13700 [Candidatus Altiarchaeales archaeon]|nr:hypothetical protein [Candidatus Altiarchaeales archaeon]
MNESRDCQLTAHKTPSSSGGDVQPKNLSNVETKDCITLGCHVGSVFAASRNSEVFHLCGCSHAKRIKPENLLCFNGTKQAYEAGYQPASCLN